MMFFMRVAPDDLKDGIVTLLKLLIRLILTFRSFLLQRQTCLCKLWTSGCLQMPSLSQFPCTSRHYTLGGRLLWLRHHRLQTQWTFWQKQPQPPLQEHLPQPWVPETVLTQFLWWLSQEPVLWRILSFGDAWRFGYSAEDRKWGDQVVSLYQFPVPRLWSLVGLHYIPRFLDRSWVISYLVRMIWLTKLSLQLTRPPKENPRRHRR